MAPDGGVAPDGSTTDDRALEPGAVEDGDDASESVHAHKLHAWNTYIMMLGVMLGVAGFAALQ